jgi:hypothetical protein
MSRYREVNSAVVRENETVARRAYSREDYVLCVLLSHALMESLLRAFLGKWGNEQFCGLIAALERRMASEGQMEVPFLKPLRDFNQRRNHMVHELWTKGYQTINAELEPSCRAAFMVFGLLTEWLETFEPGLHESGFDYE